jgi:hypothetical protein
MDRLLRPARGWRLYEQDRSSGHDQPLGILAASAQMRLQRRHDWRAGSCEAERDLEDALGSGAVMGAYLQQGAIGNRLQYSFHVTQTEIGRYVEP